MINDTIRETGIENAASRYAIRFTKNAAYATDTTYAWSCWRGGLKFSTQMDFAPAIGQFFNVEIFARNQETTINQVA